MMQVGINISADKIRTSTRMAKATMSKILAIIDKL